VPQFILDDMIESGQGRRARILCTQPRRISAVGVSQRVATERCESVGGSVGYNIRLEKRESRDTRLLFVTTGVLLRRLEGERQAERQRLATPSSHASSASTDDEKGLAGISHIIVDEVCFFSSCVGLFLWLFV
jgi:hypothetical protein